MSHRKRERRPASIEEATDLPQRFADPPLLNNTAVGMIAGMLMGLMAGYVLGSQSPRQNYAVAAPVTPAAAPSSSTGQGVSEDDIRAHRNVVNSDPTNLQANIALANRLYDASRYAEAVPYYQQAFTLNAKDISVSTDLGTALWYSGRPDDALAQYEKSLAIDPKHAQTLFNIGIVRRDGKQDVMGAIAAWEQLIAAAPGSPDAAKAQQAISEAKRQMPPSRSAGS